MTITEIARHKRSAFKLETALVLVSETPAIRATGASGERFYFACDCGERFIVDTNGEAFLADQANICPDTLEPKCPACGSVSR